MKKITLLFLLLPLLIATASGQGSSTSIRNAFSFNLGQYLVNELNLGYEHFISDNRSMEIAAGLVYRNEFWIRQTEDWTNSQYFYERGFTARISHRVYRKPSEKNNRKNYYSFGLNYQYLFFNDTWFKTDHQPTVYLTDNTGKVIDEELGTEQIYQRRFRNRIGIHFISGNIFQLGNPFELELFYGIGVRGTLSNRYDVAVSETGFGITKVYASGNRDHKIYFRPTIHAGVKLRIAW